MSEEGAFDIHQLMELAGLACAQTVYACFPPDTFPKVLVAAGPGNQGGDGLVAARHLTHFGYNVSVWYPKEGKTDMFKVGDLEQVQSHIDLTQALLLCVFCSVSRSSSSISKSASPQLMNL